MYRRSAEAVLGRVVQRVDAPDAYYIKGGVSPAQLAEVLVGRTVTGTERIGKLLLLDLDHERHALGLRFGMSGRIVVDENAVIETLQYSSGRDDPAWDRFALHFESPGGTLRINDPRRLGGVELAPDVTKLGVDLFQATPAAVRDHVVSSSVALKARLLDQRSIAGIGNLLADEILWRAGLDPARPANSLTVAETERLSRHIRSVARQMLAKGGSHMGRLQPARERRGRCPRDQTELERRTIGGRTSYSCPLHQV
ncbi:MAG: formamidopyrimidine-DNA glycosylase [Acidimicrobiales bacterium]|nr:formamidopyrimidine-DNA glycosylase [Acidimicrobiales bacterium]